jgi:transcriptional regulator with XRE-family HTH domain
MNAQKRVALPQFAKQLVKLRGTQSRGAICRALARLGLPCDRSTLLQYERGTVTAPDPALLWGLAWVYHIDVSELLVVIVGDRTGRPSRSVALNGPGLTPEQLRIAEIFGALQPPARHALTEIFDLLQAGAATSELPARSQRNA